MPKKRQAATAAAAVPTNVSEHSEAIDIDDDDAELCSLVALTPAAEAEASHDQSQIAEYERRASLVSPRSATSAWTRFGLLERLDRRARKRRKTTNAPWNDTQRIQDRHEDAHPRIEATQASVPKVPWRPGVAPPPPPARTPEQRMPSYPPLMLPPPPPMATAFYASSAPPVTPKKAIRARTPMTKHQQTAPIMRGLPPKPPAPPFESAPMRGPPQSPTAIKKEIDSPWKAASPIIWTPPSNISAAGSGPSASTPVPPRSIINPEGKGFLRVPEPPTPKGFLLGHEC
eukprot:3231371-Amphidinium_carterae.1